MLSSGCSPTACRWSTSWYGHWLTVVAFVAAITIGELFRLRMPSGREAAPLASASALGVVFLGKVYGEPDFDLPAGPVVLVVAAGLLLAALVRGVRGATIGLDHVSARLVGVAVAAWLARAFAPRGGPCGTSASTSRSHVRPSL